MTCWTAIKESILIYLINMDDGKKEGKVQKM